MEKIKKKSFNYSLILLILAIFAVFFADSRQVKADSIMATFDYNSSSIAEYVGNLADTLENKSINVGYGATLTKPTISNNLLSMYDYAWTVNGQEVDVESYVITDSTTFVARWTPKVFKIKYCFPSEQVESEIKNLKLIDYYTIESGRFNYYKPARDNYNFIDWYLSSTLEGIPVTYRPAYSIGDVLLYPKFEPIDYYINYHTDAENIDNPLTRNVEDVEIELSAPKKVGHIFLGWYLDENLTQKVTKIAPGIATLNFYPKWELIKYNVRYILPDGSIQNVATSYGHKAARPDISKNIFQVLSYSEDRDNITEDTVIYVKIINIWYVYVIAIVVIGVIVTLVLIKVKKNKLAVKRLRTMYHKKSNKGRSNARKTSKRS